MQLNMSPELRKGHSRERSRVAAKPLSPSSIVQFLYSQHLQILDPGTSNQDLCY